MQNATKARSERASRLQIPRYLGLERAEATRDGAVQLTLGHTDRLRKELTLDSEGLDFLLGFLKPTTLSSAARRVRERPAKAQRLGRDLKSAGILRPARSVPERFRRYDRHLLFYDLAGADPIAVQASLARRRVALVGMGGIGNWVSMALIGAGFGELRLIDFDDIELSNLTRQVLFTEKDVGRPKIDVAAERLAERNQGTLVRPVPLKVSSARELSAALKGVHFVVLSADQPATIHEWVDLACVKRRIPYVNLGYRDATGVIGPMTVAGRTSCYHCFKPRSEKRRAKGGARDMAELHEALNRRYQAPSFGPVNALVSSIGALEIIKYLGGFAECASMGTELTVDPFTLEIDRRAYRRDRSCWNCGHIEA
ncbi:TOMM precursor leader peptide-binding protein [Sorangium sp. So ce448]|uniref:TOMM precursor leader peptide-binding protein n=1 Tax=Sorangium sp. So ce448 TaxID=3133314 RepID=UPI003F639AD2